MASHSDLINDDSLMTQVRTSDKTNSVSSKVIRCVYDGQRAVAVGDDAESRTQIAALLDLLDLHLTGGGQHQGVDVASDSVTLLLGGRPKGQMEALDAVHTLVSILQAAPGAPRVRVLEHDAERGWVKPAATGWNIGDDAYYSRWPDLLKGVADDPPPLVAKIVELVDDEALRAYPMLTRRGHWSLRLEGLEVGKLSTRRGTLGVGKDSGAGAQSLPRRTWIAAQRGRTELLEVVDTVDSIAESAAAVRAFRDVWLRADVGPALGGKQDEHALESRILRGVVPIEVADNQLQLLRKSDTVNWGSQFPTMWGREGRARYLDGLLRDGSTPWALEMKVNGGGGVGRYYRHAIAQAVLYREFIRQASPLHFWFEQQDLDATGCQAAVVIPEFSTASDRWRPRLQALSDLFGVALVEVDNEYAALR